MIRIKPRRPNEDALVEDAVPAVVIDYAQTIEEIRAAWKDLPGPNAKRKTCAFCGGHFYRPCFDPEHKGCLNFQVTERHRNKGTPT